MGKMVLEKTYSLAGIHDHLPVYKARGRIIRSGRLLAKALLANLISYFHRKNAPLERVENEFPRPDPEKLAPIGKIKREYREYPAEGSTCRRVASVDRWATLLYHSHHL
jgi:hypothetical protein